jgi:vanillate O-demethylase ferredoxin subunit
MHLAARSRAHAAFVDELAAMARRTPGSTLDVHADDERGGPPDLKAWVGAASPGAHLYACGPRPMLDAYRSATAAWPAGQVHWESFVPAEEAAVGGGFRLVLARQGRQLDVPAGKTMLDVLLDAGVDVPYGCMQGVCGSCQTRVLAGVPDHRDGILDDATRARNDSVIVCCSGSRTPELTLDL